MSDILTLLPSLRFHRPSEILLTDAFMDSSDADGVAMTANIIGDDGRETLE